MMTRYSGYYYRSADGRLDLFARDYPGSGPTLLLMHGLTRNSADFEPLAARLAGKYRLIVPDQRGRGLSEYDNDENNYRPDVYVADMAALLDSLGIETVSAIGTSMGGLMAMVMGAVMPKRVRSVVLNDIGTEVMPEGIERIRGYVGATQPAKSWQEAAERCRNINQDAMVGFEDADWLAFAERTYRERSDGLVELAYDPAISDAIKSEENSAVPPDLWSLWDMMSELPALVIRGALSDLLSAETVTAMAERHSGPFESVEVPGRGHAPILDEQEAIAAILPFLGKYA